MLPARHGGNKEHLIDVINYAPLQWGDGPARFVACSIPSVPAQKKAYRTHPIVTLGPYLSPARVERVAFGVGECSSSTPKTRLLLQLSRLIIVSCWCVAPASGVRSLRGHTRPTPPSPLFLFPDEAMKKSISLSLARSLALALSLSSPQATSIRAGKRHRRWTNRNRNHTKMCLPYKHSHKYFGFILCSTAPPTLPPSPLSLPTNATTRSRSKRDGRQATNGRKKASLGIIYLSQCVCVCFFLSVHHYPSGIDYHAEGGPACLSHFSEAHTHTHAATFWASAARFTYSSGRTRYVSRHPRGKREARAHHNARGPSAPRRTPQPYCVCKFAGKANSNANKSFAMATREQPVPLRKVITV